MRFSRRSSWFLGGLGILAFGGQAVQAIKLDINDANSIKQAASTAAYGMMKWYNGNQTGQSIGLLPQPYYWWEAGAMFGQMIEYWFYTGDSTYNSVVTQGMLAQVGPNNDYMPPNQTKTEGNDDQVFWAFAAMSAAELNFPDPPAKSPSWLALAQAVFNLQAGRWDTTKCNGGLRWQIYLSNNGYNYKNSISNGGFFQLAARLARYTGNQTYADWAEKTYNWIRGTSLFTEDYKIYDGAQMAVNCSGATPLLWTYNIGTFMMGAANMYNYTNGSSHWRHELEGLLNSSQEFFPPEHGGNTMVEIACEPQGTCNNDQPSFKAYLSRWMAATMQLADFSADFLSKKLEASAKGAAGQCVGGTDGVTCGRTWSSTTWDGKYGVGEEMSALSAIQSVLITKVRAPVTADKGGTSKGDASAGSQGDNPQTAVLPSGYTSKITAGDKAGAGIITALVLASVLGGPYFPCGNRAPTFITASFKKRKLSTEPDDPLESRGSSSPPQLRLSEGTKSPSPPHYLPSHLAIEAQKRRSSSPESLNTGSSSPSATWAAFSLNSDGGGYASGQDNQGGRGGSAQAKLLGGAAPQRAASPAKRRASAMEKSTLQQQDEHVQDADSAEIQHVDEHSPSAEIGVPTATSRRKSKSIGSQHKREVSVDMIGEEGAREHEMLGGAASAGRPVDSLPSIDDQIKQVMELATQTNEGQKGFIVASKWLSRVLARGSNVAKPEKHGKEAQEGPIGPVDNSGINLVLDPNHGELKDEKNEPFVPLKPGLTMPEDFEVLPQAAWDLVIEWYGLASGSPIITRYAHNTSTNETLENIIYELYPPVFTLLKLPYYDGVSQKSLGERDTKPVRLLASRHELYQNFLKRVKALSNIELKTKVRVWRILGGLAGASKEGLLTPAQSRSVSPAPGAMIQVDAGDKLVLDVNTFAQLQLGDQRERIEFQDETANENYNGHLSLHTAGLSQDSVLVLEEQIGGPAGGEWVSDASTTKAKTNGVAVSVTRSGTTTVQSSLKPSAANNSRSSSPARAGMMTRGRQNKTGRAKGTTGLSNLGNTCYMNSALQCVRSVEELTLYFLENEHKRELNMENPLSYKGAVAQSYAELLRQMYNSSQHSAFAPRNFKATISKHGPSFSGYGQQDSQEFLLFLLDGLQEDLNRITKKPYIEKPDSTDEMVNDPKALREMADKCWDIYKKRNDSVITDLFAGMYKSTVVCPVCAKVSIIFDPFNNLTLQLPIESVWSRSIYFFPLHSRPITVSVDLSKNSSWFDVKEFVASRFPGVNPKNMITGEIYKQKFYRFFEDDQIVGEETLQDSDDIAVFELEDRPTNYPTQKKNKKSYVTYSASSDDDIPADDSSLADKMVVTVFLRRSQDGYTRYSQKDKALFGVPSFILLTKEDAKNFDVILQKCLAQLDNLTTRDFLREDDSEEDSDTVSMNADEVDSDSKVHTESLESEDGMVDISMKDPPERISGPPQPKHRPRRAPAPMLRPGSFISPGVRHLFEMKYVARNQMVPYGISSLGDESAEWSTLASRAQNLMSLVDRSSTRAKINKRMQNIDESPPTSDEDEDTEHTPSQALMQGSTSDSDDDGLPEVEQIIQPKLAHGALSNKEKRHNKKELITYSKKGKRAISTVTGRTEKGLDEPGPLLRLGEALVLDFTPEGYDALFGGTETRDEEAMRGSPTWDDIPVYPDPALEEKRKARTIRKRNGFSLGDCLDEFGKPETLSQNDAWYCPRCKEHRRASKTFELWKAPDIVVIHLKRFSSQGRFNNKLDVNVDFPLEGLDLSSRLATQEDEKSQIYDLIAVDNHYGGLGGGHYTAYAKNFYDRNWYEYNDSSVTKKSPQQVITTSAYLLFYRRRTSTCLGGPFFERIMTAANDTLESQPTSRAASPSGEGKRLDDSSRNGSSSALRGVGAAHQPGGGGSADGTIVQMRTGVDDELPAYSSVDPQKLHNGDTLETLAMDEDEGIGGVEDLDPHGNGYDFSDDQQWSFDRLDKGSMSQQLTVPPGSDVGDAESVRHGSTFSRDEGNRMADFADDEGTVTSVFGSHDDPDAMETVPFSRHTEYDDEAVAEVTVPDTEEEETKMD